MRNCKGKIVITGLLMAILLSACQFQQEGNLEPSGVISVSPVPVPTESVESEPEITEAPAEPPVTTPVIHMADGPRQVDLDGDGYVDELLVEVQDGASPWAARRFHISINGKDYYEEAMSEQFWENPVETHYGLWRLNPEANWLAVGVYYDGPSGDPVTMFYKYREGLLFYVGMVEGYPEENQEFAHFQNVWLDEEGYLHTTMRLSILQTWWANVRWKLDDEGNLVLVEENVYEVVEGSSGPYRLIGDLLVYPEPDREAESSWMLAEQEVFITGTDNENWCLVETTDGIVGWFYVDDYYKIVDVGLNADEVFDGLCYAD